ncbi:hypothetical protein [Dactylosporangium sp. NPDC051484]|uniref:hypothetical protein n=1 Tax=Dactylosporangium sp. NPDC051484 TaxID=3154942 RepID=UPI00344B1653
MTGFVVVLGALVQLTGVSAVGNFSPRIFEGMGYRGMSTLGGATTFAALLAVTVASWLYLFRQAPETRGRTLEEIHEYWQNGRTWPRPVTSD